MVEKRKARRKISRTQVRFGETECDKIAFTSNLSRDGFFVRTNRSLPPGRLLFFEFQLSDGRRIRVQGRVVHASRNPAQMARVRRSGMGIEIVGDKETYLEILRDLKLYGI